MSTDDLIASLCADGRVDSHGGFTLDREKAREKLRTFQVAEPHRYVLHLVALAVLRGATRVEFTIDTDDMWCRFDGAPLTEQDFEDLYGSSFSEAQGDADKARQQLAVGLHAALALDPRHVRVISGAPGERVRLVARHGAEDRIERVEDGGQGTEIHVKQRLRPKLAIRFVRHVRGALPEVRALRHHCGHARIPVALGGEVLSAGLEPREDGIQFMVRVADLGGRTCAAGLRADAGATPEVRLVRHGVWIATLHPDYLPLGLLAIVADDGLRTDLSATGVIQGAQLDLCLALVDRAAEEACIAWIAGHGDELHEAALARLRPVWKGWVQALDRTTRIGAALAGLPWFKDMFGRPATIGQIDAHVARTGSALYTPGEFAGKLAQYPELVIATRPTASGPSRDLLLLRDLYGAKLRDATRDLECEVRRETNRRRWMARPAATELQPGPYYAVGQARIDTRKGIVEGVVGLRRRTTAPSTVRMLADGHVLCDLEVELPLPIDATLAGLAPGLEFEAPLPDTRYALGLLALLDAALFVVESEMSSWTGEPTDGQRDLARAYLSVRHDPAGPRGWLERFGFTRASAQQFAERAPDELTRICKQAAPLPLATVMEPWLANLERLWTASGRTLSLGAVALALERGVTVAFTETRVHPMPNLEKLVLCVDERTRAIVERVFGPQVPALTAEELQQLIDEQRFMDQEEEEPALPDGCVAQVRVERGSLRAVLGVMSDPGEPGGVRVLVRGRFLCDKRLWFALPGVVAALRDDGLRPTVDYTGVVDDAAWKTAVRDLQRAAARLGAEVVAAAREGRAPADRLADVLLASFPTVALRRAWDRLMAAQGRAAAESTYNLLLGMVGAADPEQLEKALIAQLARRPPPGKKKRDPMVDVAQIADRAEARLDRDRGEFVAAILRELRTACGQTRAGVGLAQMVAAPAPDLMAALPLARSDGRAGSFAEARALADALQPIPIVRASDGGLAPGRWAYVVTPEQEDRLIRMFGEAALRLEIATSQRLPTRSEPTSTPLPKPPRDALTYVKIDTHDVRGAVWLTQGVEDEKCRVGVYDERGDRLSRVTLLPPLPLAGALTGAGIRSEGYVVEMSTAARAAVIDAVKVLYDELLRRTDGFAVQACEILHGRIGRTAVPPELTEIRARLAERTPKPRPARKKRKKKQTEDEDVLRDIFDELDGQPPPPPPAPAPPAPRPAPIESPPVPPPQPPEVRLLEAIRDELRSLRALHDRLLSNFNLKHLRLAPLGGAGDPVVIEQEAVVLDAGHPLVRRAAAEFARDPVWVDLLASLVFTAFNEWRPEITDADETTFHASHLARVARRHGLR